MKSKYNAKFYCNMPQVQMGFWTMVILIVVIDIIHSPKTNISNKGKHLKHYKQGIFNVFWSISEIHKKKSVLKQRRTFPRPSFSTLYTKVQMFLQNVASSVL